MTSKPPSPEPEGFPSILRFNVADISVGFKLYTIAYAYEQATSWYDLHSNL
jgi:hypothetical protein